MKKRNEMMLMIFTITIATALLMPAMIHAGSLEPTSPPGPTTQIPPAWSQTIAGTERFELVLGGAGVLDKETGLVWEQSPQILTKNWADSIIYCPTKELGNRKGWRLPAVEELATLVDPTQNLPSLPTGHPFSNVQTAHYWSTTTSPSDDTYAWTVNFANGFVGPSYTKIVLQYIWCVRGGHGYDAY